MSWTEDGVDHVEVFSHLRAPLALVSTLGGCCTVSAASAGFRAAIGIGQEHAGQAILPLLPSEWRSPVERAIRAVAGARRSKRVRGLPGGRGQMELDVYRAAGARQRGHLLLALEELDHAAWYADPRVVSLFPQLQTNNAALVYESDIKAERSRYSDNGLIARFGLSSGSITFADFKSRLHPEDTPQLDRFWAARAGLADNEINTLTARMRASSGEWRLINLRARVLRRDPDGAPRRMLGLCIDITDHNAMTEALNEAHFALSRAEDDERRRIGRELHDSTAQHLLAISFGLSNLERDATPSQVVQTSVRDIRQAVEAAGREIRMFSFLLHPPELAETGLSLALERFCADFARRTGLDVRLSTSGGGGRASDQVEAAIYRVAQESLMNTFRHARATRIRLKLDWLASSVALEVTDDGAGLSDRRHEGVGMQAMRARMIGIGGTLEFETGHTGLTVMARAPLAGDAPRS